MWAWKGLRSMTSVFRMNQRVVQMVACLLWMQVVMGSSPVSLNVMGYIMYWFLSMQVCGTWREGSNPSIPTIIPCQRSNGSVCKTLFHRCKSYRDVHYRWLAQLVRVSALQAEGHRFKSCITYHFSYFNK